MMVCPNAIFSNNLNFQRIQRFLKISQEFVFVVQTREKLTVGFEIILEIDQK